VQACSLVFDSYNVPRHVDGTFSALSMAAFALG
jgi:hypothetical protein